jgi:hypothetical protein
MKRMTGIVHNLFEVHALSEDESDDMEYNFDDKLQCIFDQFPKYCMKIMPGDFAVKLGIESILKWAVRNYKLHKTNNCNGSRVVSCYIRKYVKSTMIQHYSTSQICNDSHSYTW